MQVRFEEEFKMSQHNQIKDDLEVLEIDITQKLTIRYVTLKYKKLAKVVHPDRKGGDKCKLSKPQLNHNSTQPNITLTLLVPGGVFRTPSTFAAFGDPLKVKYIEMFHADFSYLSIY